MLTTLGAHQLHVFLTAAEELNFTAAAGQLQMTQPSVSQHIQALEEHFGVPLFSRVGRSIELTDAGQALIPLARELVNTAIHIEETMASLKGDVYGHLILACSTSSGRYILPKLLACFHRLHPMVRDTCKATSQSQALNMLADGKVHLAFAANPPISLDIEFRRFTTEQMILIAPPDHSWALRGEISLPELFEADFILPDDTSEVYHSLREALAQHGRSIYELNPLISLGSLEAIALSVQEGMGVAYVPLLLANRLVAGQVAHIHVSGLQVQREIFIGRNTRRQASAAQTAFWEMLFDLQNPVIQDINRMVQADPA